MQNETTINPPPDWATQEKDLLCPLCGYNLRGLIESRCPECGFKFTWHELLEEEQNRHKYIFEHGRGNNFKSFWKTYWRTCQPRWFWNDLNPAQPVRLFRLMLYWMIGSGFMGCCLSASRAGDIIQMARSNIATRSSPPPGFVLTPGGSPVPFTPSQMAAGWPLPWEFGFWRRVFFSSNRYYYGRGHASGLGWAGVFLVWPWLTLISLFIFRISMRQAKIRTVHLLRTVIYSCDFGLLLTIAFVAEFLSDAHLRHLPYTHSFAEGWLLLTAAIVCSAITSYRLTIAFRQYLRVHLPLATVLASQVIAFLIVFLLLVQIADFSRRV